MTMKNATATTVGASRPRRFGVRFWLSLDAVLWILLGVLAIVAPLIAGLATVALFAVLLIAAGVVGLVGLFRSGRRGAWGWRLSYTLTWPSKRMAAPATSGLPCCTQARLMAWRVLKLSLQSSTTSTCGTRVSSSAASARAVTVCTWTSGLMAAMAAAAEATLGWPTLLVRWAIWRCRLVRSTVSWSTRVIWPTPAEARYRATGEPSPPAPMTSAWPARMCSWPSMPISSSRMWRE